MTTFDTVAEAVNSGVCENKPNAGKLMSSLRHLDYSNISAVCDLVDNSIDAGADCIHVRVRSAEPSKQFKVEVWDNGRGMDLQTLREAMRLGSKTEKNSQYDLGKYGMGLVTSSISIGERLAVFTSCDGKTVIKSVQDLEDIREKDDFFVRLTEVKGEDASKWQDILTKLASKISINNIKTQSDEKPLITGTSVIISKIDRWQWKTEKGAVDRLVLALGQTFRKFISSGKDIYVNEVKVDAIDPIYDFEPTLLAEESIKIEDENLVVKVFELKDYGRQLNQDKGFNIANQGFTVLRNNREISFGQTFGIWTKHNDYNLLRIELSYSGFLDDLMNVGFTKQNVTPQGNQSIYDKLKSFINPHLKQVRHRAKKRQEDNRDKKEDFSEVEKYITQKAHLLKTPPAVIEKRDPKQNKQSEKVKEEISQRGARLDITKKKPVDISSLKVKFRTKSMDKAGPLYTSEMEGDVTSIYWNIDHPFYQDFIIPHEDDKEVLNPICFLVYSLASAELRASSESDSIRVIENIRADLSQNLRVLMNS